MSSAHKPDLDIRWYYANGTQKLGPLSLAELQQLARSGRIQPASMVLREGSDQWLPASSVSGIFTGSVADAGPDRVGIVSAAPSTIPQTKPPNPSAKTVLAPDRQETD